MPEPVTQTVEVSLSDALALYNAAERPPLCPRCGHWETLNVDGDPVRAARPPFCTDSSHSHRETCSRYTFAAEPCATCDAEMGAETERVHGYLAALDDPDSRHDEEDSNRG